MIFQVHIPAFPLNTFIKNFFYYEGFEAAHSMDRFLPDGNTEIIISLNENTQYIYDNESLKEIQACRHAWVSGVRTKAITIPSGKGSRMLIVAFKKGMAHPFYSLPMSELTDQVVAADLVFGRRFCDLREQLLHAASIDQMFLLVEKFLFQQAGDSLHADVPSKCIEYAVSNIVDKPDVAGFQELSDHIGYSQKHFIELFKRQVGVRPRQYLRIMRFQKAVLEIEHNQSVHWSSVALESGYYDQAHFINDFKTFSGFTPNEYIKRKTDLLNYIPVD
jgi:AraC-like DNA-binding protein